MKNIFFAKYTASELHIKEYLLLYINSFLYQFLVYVHCYILQLIINCVINHTDMQQFIVGNKHNMFSYENFL